MRSPGRTLELIALLLTVGGCLDPRFEVVVQLPDGIERDGLRVVLSIFAPAAGSEVDCDQIAWGDVTLDDLYSTRVYDRELLSPGADSQVPATTVPISRAGSKLLVALGSYGGAGELTLAQAVLAGCARVEAIAGNTRLTLATERTAIARVSSSSELFLSAEIEGDAGAAVSIEEYRSDGTLQALEGLPIVLEAAPREEDEAGEALDGRVRVDVKNLDGSVQSRQVVGPARALTVPLQVDGAGPFFVELRAHYQHGKDPPQLSGLARSTLLDSSGSRAKDQELASLLEQATWVSCGPLGQIDGQPARSGLAVLRPIVGPPPSVVFTAVPLAASADGGVAAQPALTTVDIPGHVFLLGLVRTHDSGQGLAALAVEPEKLPASPAVRPGAILLSDGVSAQPARIELPVDGMVALSARAPAIEAATCDGGGSPASLLAGLYEATFQQSGARADGEALSELWRIDVDSVSPLQVSHSLLPTPSRPWQRIQQSVCVDDAVRGRLPFLISLQVGLSVPTLSEFDPTSGTMSAGMVILAELVRASPAITLDLMASRVLALPLFHSDAIEINAYDTESLDGAFTGLRYRARLLLDPVGVMPAKILIAAGSFVEAEQPSLAALVLRVDRGPLLGELHVTGLDESRWDTTAPLRYQLDPGCNNMAAGFCQVPERTTLQGVDLDDDGLDELVLVTWDGAPAAPRVRVIRLGTRP